MVTDQVIGASARYPTSIYLPMDRRQALAYDQTLPEYAQGSVLFADISGFTQLAEALKRALGPRRGSEELADHLNVVYDALIAEVDRYGGSVISFSGDAITCWFDASQPLQNNQPPVLPALRAVASALTMQQSLHQVEAFEVAGQGQVALKMKAAVVSGSVRRLVVGNPSIQVIDVIGGTVMERMAVAEHLASRDEVVIDVATAQHLGAQVQIGDWRIDAESGKRYAVVEQLFTSVLPQPWPDLPLDALDDEDVRPWLLPPVYERLRSELGEFLTELRPTVALFLRFGFIDFDQDADAGQKLDRYIRWVQQVLQRYDGVLSQLTVGDKGSYIYASFGAPVAHEDDALRAVNAALELSVLPPELHYICQVQMGINQGTMRTGSYGSRTRRTYGVLGDDTNLAARLMQAASPDGEILVSGPVMKSVGSACVWLQRPPIQVKGKREPVEVAILVGKGGEHLEAVRFMGMMIGREAEMEQLWEALAPLRVEPSPGDQATPEAGRFAGMVYVTGEAGVGKSRLIYELRQRLGVTQLLGAARQPGQVQWFECQTEPILHQSLHPFKAFLHQYFEQSNEQDDADNKQCFYQVLERLLARLESEAEYSLRTQLDRIRSILGALVDLHWEDSLYERLEPKLRFENTLLAFKLLILAESLQSPVVLHIEDAHWLDVDSQALLKLLVSNVADYPFAVLFSGRCYEEDAFFPMRLDAPVSQQVIELEQLPDEASRLLAEQVLSGRQEAAWALSEDLAAFLKEKSGGNPLFLERLVLELQERDLVDVENGAWTLASQGLEEVPATLNALLISQLDRLDNRVRATVQTASVLGTEFEVPVLQNMLPTEEHLPSLVRQAQERLIWLLAAELHYLFRHSLLRDAAYDMQPETRLQELHAQAAQAIQKVYDADLGPHYADLAHHFERARQPSMALTFARLAGEHAAASYANRQAIDHYRQALRSAAQLEASQTFEARLALHAALGELLVTTGQHQPAQEHLSQALALAEECGDGDAQARACRWLARLFESRGKYPDALEWIKRGLAVLGERETAETSELLNYAGLIYSRQGDYANALEYAQRCKRIADVSANLNAQARAHNLLGHIARLRGEHIVADEHFQHALELYQQTGDINGQALVHNQRASALCVLGNWQDAARYFGMARQIFDQMSDTYHRAFTDNNLGWIALNQGRLDDALLLYQQGLIAAEQIGGSLWMIGGFHTNLGDTYIRRGDAQFALYHLRISQSYFEQAGARDWLPELYRHMASAMLLSGDLEHAQSWAEQAISLARELKMRPEEGSALRVLGEIAAVKGNLSQAQEYLRSSLEVLSEVSSEYEHARSQLALARMYELLDEKESVQALLSLCVPVFERLGADLDLDIARRLSNPRISS